ncbi:MAG: hypothetical protein K0S58_1014 [Nitrospira sp.]|nr:hypothetical protein [Nitrospira sp.]
MDLSGEGPFGEEKLDIHMLIHRFCVETSLTRVRRSSEASERGIENGKNLEGSRQDTTPNRLIMRRAQ